MTQVFFFLTMLTAAALMIYLLWYLRDSHEAEERFIAGRLAAKDRRRRAEAAYSNVLKAGAGVPAYASSSASSNLSTGALGYSAGSVRPVQADKIAAVFFDVGTPDDVSNRTDLPYDRNQCA